MPLPRTISLTQAVTWLAWGERFTAEDFMAVDSLKVNIGELRRYRQNLEEGKKPVVSSDDLKIYQGAVAADQKIVKRIKEASGHSYKSKTGRNDAKKELDDAFAVIVGAIQDGRLVESVQGQSGIDNEGRKSIPWEWFDKNPEPTAFYEINALGHGTSPDIYGIEQPNLKNGWKDVEFDWDKIQTLRDKTNAWPLNQRSELAPAPDSKGGATVPPPNKRGGGLKRGRYYEPLKKHLKWRKDNRDDLDTASLKTLREDAWKRLITDKVEDIPKSRSAMEDAIKDALKTLDVNR